MKRVLVTGITGQDGSYLTELLLSKRYEVHGVRLFLHYGDMGDSVNLVKLLYELKPDEIDHLGAQSHMRVSFDIPEYTADVTGVGTIRILEAIREVGRTRFYQADRQEYGLSAIHLLPVNLGSGHQISINDLIGLIARLTNFTGDIRWDAPKPDGQPRRCLGTQRARTEFGFQAGTSLESGLQETINWYEQSAQRGK